MVEVIGNEFMSLASENCFFVPLLSRHGKATDDTIMA